jgi:hypothetical protein
VLRVRRSARKVAGIRRSCGGSVAGSDWSNEYGGAKEQAVDLVLDYAKADGFEISHCDHCVSLQTIASSLASNGKYVTLDGAMALTWRYGHPGQVLGIERFSGGESGGSSY